MIGLFPEREFRRKNKLFQELVWFVLAELSFGHWDIQGEVFNRQLGMSLRVQNRNLDWK